MPARTRRVAVLAHCHLNVNTKVHGLAAYAAARGDLLRRLVDEEIGIVQLPCPEATYLGIHRWGMTREQYDVPAFRRHCRALLAPVVDTLVALADDGCEIVAVYGVDGSPSCAVLSTCEGYEGGEIDLMLRGDAPPAAHPIAGRGILMQELADMLESAGLAIPMIGIDEHSAAHGRDS